MGVYIPAWKYQELVREGKIKAKSTKTGWLETASVMAVLLLAAVSMAVLI